MYTYSTNIIHKSQYKHLCYKVSLDHKWPSSSDTFKRIMHLFLYGMAGTEVVASLDDRPLYKMGAHIAILLSG